MNRNVTAIYRTYEVADLVRKRLLELGISLSNIHVIPDRDETAGSGGYSAGTATDRDGTVGTSGYTDPGTSTDRTGQLGSFGYTDGVGDKRFSEAGYMDQLHDLGLPEEDLRTYQQSVGRGDYVVSVEVDDNDVARIQETMRRPEEDTYEIEARAAEFRDESLVAHSDANRSYDESRRGVRDTDHTDPYTRIYRRGGSGTGTTS